MNPSLEPQPAGPFRNSPGPWYRRSTVGATAEQSRYRSVSVPAVLSIVCGALSILTVLDPMFAAVPLAGIVLAWTALRRIRRQPELLVGATAAWTGLAMSLALGGAGLVGLKLMGLGGTPRGYKAISFDDLEGQISAAGLLLPQKAKDLEDKKIFIKGFMYPGRWTQNIREFILVPTMSHCNFCSKQLKSTEMIYVRMAGDLRATFDTSQVRVGGVFRIDEEQAGTPYGALPYQVDADYFD